MIGWTEIDTSPEGSITEDEVLDVHDFFAKLERVALPLRWASTDAETSDPALTVPARNT